MRRILVVDDKPIIRLELRRLLSRAGHTVAVASDVPEARSLGLDSFDLILTDHRMPGESGDVLIEEATGVPVVVMTAHGTVRSAVDAMKRGAADYLLKPFEPDELTLVVQRVLRTSSLERQNAVLRSEVEARWSVDGMVGQSAGMQAAFRLVRKAAPTEATVLVTGESGTGKELVARAIHRLSPRRDEAFVAVNCASIPESLIESELFGHEKGAFTGALTSHKGLFRAASLGTLFLDEIGELPAKAQARLLRVLQEQRVRPVGSTRDIAIHTRIIAATHRDLPKMVSTGEFRKDLYFRLRVVEIPLPPLRDRGPDRTAIADAIVTRASGRFGKPGVVLSEDARQAVDAYEWPGNVRELENAIERAFILHEAGPITASLLGLPEAEDATSPLPELSATSLDDYFRAFVLKHEGSLSETETARRLGISRKSLWERRKRMGIPRKR